MYFRQRSWLESGPRRRSSCGGSGRGLGDSTPFWPSSFADSPTCGPNPCNVLDDVYARDACVQWLTCAYPTAPTTVGFNSGAIAGATVAVADSIGSEATGAVDAIASSSTAITGVLIAAGVVLALLMIEGGKGRR